ncbi:hypothetical protein ACN93_00140 [Gordonia paraffinivorans]|nr:hypothetical protein ACN93_00140 [Gordonia paraffinivorans]
MMTEVGILTRADLSSVVELLSASVDEIPMYSWVLGEHLSDRELRAWLAEILVRPYLNAGYVLGARESGRLVGALVWQPHDADLTSDGTPLLTPDDFVRVARIPGVRERLAAWLTSPQLPVPVPDAVNLRIAVVAPEARGGDTLVELVRRVERFCAETCRPYYAWTGSPRLREWFCSVWNATDFATVDFHGIALYGIESERPPRPARVELRQSRSSSPIV